MISHTNTEFILRKFSHELRNPLTSLYSTLQLLESRYPEVKDFKYWSGLFNDIDYMNRLLCDFSDFAKMDQLQLETFSFRALLEQIVLSFAASISDSDVEFTSKIDVSVTQITGDKTKIQEVILNLLRNAYEASAHNGNIYLEAYSDEQHIIVKICDTGCGIAPEHLPTIFEPFVTHKKQGTGLGLAICKQVVQAHHGTIKADSSLGKGTTFWVTFPIH